MITSLKHKHSKTCSHNSAASRAQLDLFVRKPSLHRQTNQQRPAITAKLAPASWHRSKSDRYWIFCNHVGKPFGGLFYRPEVDYVLAHFHGRSGLIEPHEFNSVADKAIAVHTKQWGVTA